MVEGVNMTEADIDGISSSANSNPDQTPIPKLNLRKEPPYWFDYDTHVKARWVGRKLLEVLVTEFRDRSSEYYQWAIHAGMCRVNGEKANPNHILKMSDSIQHRVHRHEPAVTAEPIRVLERNDELGRLVVVKPGSIPVHATGRYTKLTLIHMLQEELNIPTIQTSNRLDRLTSGILVCTTRKDTAHTLSEQFAMGKVRKAYVCRVRGKFPEKEILVEEPLLQCDRQSGTSIVHPMGKHSETIFNRLSYDERSNTSVVYCRPITGRTHQIRVHVQYLGHPIVNDPIYAHPIWDKYPPKIFGSMQLKEQRWKIDPGSSLNIWGSSELDTVVATLKMTKDDNEDWARWRDEILFGQLLKEEGVQKMDVPGANGESVSDQRERSEKVDENKLIVQEGKSKTKFCDECKTPLLPDPKAEELFIYLHAIKYQTDEWTYEDQLPLWALADWQENNKARSTNGSRIQNGISSDATMCPAFGLVGRGEKVVRERVRLPELQPLVTVPEQISKIFVVEKSLEQSTLSHPPVVFEVFGGVEDFAAHDIALQLSTIYGKPMADLDYQLYNSHLALPAGEKSALALQLYLDGQISSVKTAYVQIAAPNLPTETMLALSNEKEKLYEAKSIATKNRKKVGTTENVTATADDVINQVPGMDGKLTPAEHTFMEILRKVWDEFKDGREEAFKVWQNLEGQHIDQTRKPRFRASCDRRGYSLPTLTTGQIERDLGDYIWFWLNGDPDISEGDWEVNLVQFDLDIVLKLLAGQENDKTELEPHWATNRDNVAGRFAFLIPIKVKTLPKHRPILPGDLINTGTVLARFRAYSLATALPLSVEKIMLAKERNSEEDQRLRIWEPCAGSGTVAVELAAACERRGIECQIFASDVSEGEIERAKQMLNLCGYQNSIILSTVDATKIQDALTFMGEENSIDGIVTDLPWGRRSLTHQAISKLYPAMFQTFYRMLRPGAVALVMTAEHNNLLRAAKAHEAESRRRGYEWFLNVEEFTLTPCTEEGEEDENNTKQAPTDEQRSASVRLVHCGYYVSLVLLRKIPLTV